MKKLMSILIALVITLTVFTVPAYAEDLYEGDFYIDVRGGSEKIAISWDEFYGADYYEVSIKAPDEYYNINEITTQTSFDWNPDYFISPEDMFEITVFACDNSGSVIAMSNMVQIYIVVYMCDDFGVYGDVDYDQMVSVLDATVVQRYLANTDSFNVMQKKLGDVDYDGKITVLDATYIQQSCSNIYNSSNLAGQPTMIGWVEYDVHFDRWWE